MKLLVLFITSFALSFSSFAMLANEPLEKAPIEISSDPVVAEKQLFEQIADLPVSIHGSFIMKETNVIARSGYSTIVIEQFNPVNIIFNPTKFFLEARNKAIKIVMADFKVAGITIIEVRAFLKYIHFDSRTGSFSAKLHDEGVPAIERKIEKEIEQHLNLLFSKKMTRILKLIDSTRRDGSVVKVQKMIQSFLKLFASSNTSGAKKEGVNPAQIKSFPPYQLNAFLEVQNQDEYDQIFSMNGGYVYLEPMQFLRFGFMANGMNDNFKIANLFLEASSDGLYISRSQDKQAIEQGGHIRKIEIDAWRGVVIDSRLGASDIADFFEILFTGLSSPQNIINGKPCDCTFSEEMDEQFLNKHIRSSIFQFIHFFGLHTEKQMRMFLEPRLLNYIQRNVEEYVENQD